MAEPVARESPMIEVRHLRKAFGGKVVLEDVSFRIPRGAVCVVMGGEGERQVNHTTPSHRGAQTGCRGNLSRWRGDHLPIGTGFVAGATQNRHVVSRWRLAQLTHGG